MNSAGGRQAVAAVAIAILASACGSTVQQRGQIPGSAGLSSGSSSGSPLAGGLGAGATGDATGPASGTPAGPADAAGGGSNGTGSGPVPTPQSVVAASGRPVVTSGTTGPAVTKPILLGVLGVKSAAAAGSKLGLQNGNTISPTDALLGVIAGMNRAGGMGGRQIRTVLREIDPTSNSYETDYAAACEAFVRDKHVELVVSIDGTFNDSFEDCLARAKIAHIGAGYATTSSSRLGTLRSAFNADSPTVDRRLRGALSTLAAAGILRRGDVLGVVVEACPANKEAYQRAVVPTARAAGVTLLRYDIDCVSGFSSAGASSAAIGNAVLKFHSSGVTAVSFVSSFEATGLPVFANAAENQGWHPRYALTSASVLTVNQPNLPAGQLPGMSVGGWLPLADDAGAQLRTNSEQRCLKLLRDGNVQASTLADRLYLVFACDSLLLADAGLTATRGQTSLDTLIPALEHLNTTVAIPGTVDNRSRYSPAQHDGAVLFRASQYVSSCKCFRYTGPPREVP